MARRAHNATEAPSTPDPSSSSDGPRPRHPGPVPVRVRQAHIDWLHERMSPRDLQIAREVNRLRVASGDQLERLCFTETTEGRSRIATRSRVLRRLVAWRVLVPVGRRVGGRQRGSTAQVYALDSGGQRLLAGQQLADGERVRVRRPGPPGERSLRHLLAVAELYVDLTQRCRAAGLALVRFQAEPAAHWPGGQGGVLKPDAYAVLARPGARDHWWLEVDMATESLPTVRAQLEAYVDFQRRGERGPEGVTPWVLVVAVTERRRDAIADMVRRLPSAGDLVTVVHAAEAARHMIERLQKP